MSFTPSHRQRERRIRSTSRRENDRNVVTGGPLSDGLEAPQDGL
jgi:hypothetical protein